MAEDFQGTMHMIFGIEKKINMEGNHTGLIKFNYNHNFTARFHTSTTNDTEGAIIKAGEEDEELMVILFTASNDRTIKIFNINPPKVLGVLKRHKGPVTSISFNEATNTLVSGSRDKSVIVWRKKPKKQGENFNPEFSEIIKDKYDSKAEAPV